MLERGLLIDAIILLGLRMFLIIYEYIVDLQLRSLEDNAEIQTENEIGYLGLICS